MSISQVDASPPANPQVDPREVIFSGRDHRDAYSDFVWSFLHKPNGNWAIRITGFVMRKAFRKMCSRITFDQVSFEAAMAQRDPKTLVVLAPTHRSLMDFVVCSYLCFEHPELKISIPYIAADLQIGNLPFLGWFLKQTYAFYLKRGRGKADPALNQQIRQLVEQQQTLEMFIEGTRSRARQCLKPKRGLLRALQNTGVSCTLLPISISYDRLPEEKALIKELYGGPKPLMRLSSLFKWIGEMVRGEIVVGRVHLVCGDPITLTPESDVHQVSVDVVGQLQRHYVVTTFHLRAFLQQQPLPGWTVERLRQCLMDQGVTVLESDLVDLTTVDAITEYTYRNQWLHAFYGELYTRWGEHPVVKQHLDNHCFLPKDAALVPDNAAANPDLKMLLPVVFEPLVTAYQTLLQVIEDHDEIAQAHPRDFVAVHSHCFLPWVEEALEHLLEAQVLHKKEDGTGFVQGPQWHQRVARYRTPFWQQDTVLSH